jgi:hypothetical protein
VTKSTRREQRNSADSRGCYTVTHARRNDGEFSICVLPFLLAAAALALLATAGALGTRAVGVTAVVL